MPAIERTEPVNRTKFPTNRELAWAILEVLKAYRRPLATSEIPFPVVNVLSLDPRILDIKRKNGEGCEVPFRIGWVLTKLKIRGAVDNIERGYWTLTRDGRLFRDRGKVREALIREFGPETFFGNKDVKNSERGLLGRLREMDPKSFERICGEFLQKSGILRIDVTGRTSNGSFEGTGVIQVSTIFFRVFFRCRRFSEAIDKDEIINFRGTMVGRTENALYITTSRFSESALDESNREGVPPICLINGVGLCDQLKKLEIEE